MRRPLLVLSLLLCATLAAAAAGVLTCSRDLRGDGTPTDVAVGPDGILYLMYGQEGRLELVRTDGTKLQARGQGGTERAPTAMNPVSLWVGPFAGPTMLAAEAGQASPEWVLRLKNGRLGAQRLTGAQLGTPAAGAPGPDGRYYVACGGSLHAFGPTGALQYREPLATMSPRALAVDGKRNVYVLDPRGLQVFDAKGRPRYSLEGARAFHLASDDRLVAAGQDWVRKYSTDGKLLAEAMTYGREALAVSVSEEGGMFAYDRDPATGRGVVTRYDTRGDALEEFPQPPRFPSAVDPGIRLDGRGRVYAWDAKVGALVKTHPGGKVELTASFAPPPDPKGRLSRPGDMVLDSDGVLWIADTGNYRLQRFHRDEGWLAPVPVGIRGGPPQAEPRQVAVDGRGAILSVVHPPSGKGQVVLQRRDRRGRLLAQSDLGGAEGSPVVKLAVGNSGDVFLYRSDNRMWGPALARLDSRGRTVARVGGDERTFHLPGQAATRLPLKPEEDMIAWRDGVILPVGSGLAFVNAKLEVTALREVRHKRPEGVTPDYGGGAVSGGRVLYLADLANSVVHRIPLEGN